MVTVQTHLKHRERVYDLRQAEVRDFNDGRMIISQQHILWFEVAMDDALFMDILRSVRYSSNDHKTAHTHCQCLTDLVREVLPFGFDYHTCVSANL